MNDPEQELKKQSEDVFQCDLCNFVTTRKDAIKRHTATIHSDVLHQCEVCDFNSNRRDSLRRHTRIKHSDVRRKRPIIVQDEEAGPSKFSCLHCSATFTQRSSLHTHNNTKHSNNLGRFMCEECGSTFPRLDYLKSHQAQHRKRKSKEDNAPPQKKVRGRVDSDSDSEEFTPPDVEQSSFSRSTLEKRWLLRGVSDPLQALKKFKAKIQHSLNLVLRKNVLKFFLTMKIRMFQMDKDGNKKFASAGFYGGTHTLLRQSQFEEAYTLSTAQIWKSFDHWLKNGSGWVLDRVEQITLRTAKYKPMRGSSFIETPDSIKGKLAVINVHNEDQKCFEYAYLTAKHHHEIVQKDAHRPGQYQSWIGKELNLTGCSEPVQIDDIERIEKMNNVCFNVYAIIEGGKQINPIYCTKVRDQSPINLLLIEGKEKSHYAWIKNFNRLLNYKHEDQKVHCPYCCYGFVKKRNGEQNLKNHMEYCVEYAPQRTKIPREDKRWIKFNDEAKMLRLPAVMYADFETNNVKIHGKDVQGKDAGGYNTYYDEDEEVTLEDIGEDNEASYTRKQTRHDVTGYCFSVVSPHFKTRTYKYRGVDAGVRFLEAILKQEIEIRQWIKENEKEMDPLSKEEEEEFRKATTCHICGEGFSAATCENQSVHLKNIKSLLELNQMNLDKIPSLNQVKRTKRVLSLLLHPDKKGEAFTEIYQNFLNANEKLFNYLIEHQLNVEDKDLEQEEFTEEELARIMKKGWRVRDHDHWTGKYRGPAHNSCNMAYRKVKKIPMFFHNLSGYDGHIIFQNLSKIKERNKRVKDPQVIAKTMEKFIAFSIGNVYFKDSLQFLTGSLQTLTKNLKAKGEEEKMEMKKTFPNSWQYFQENWNHLDDAAFEMLTKKLPYPYMYMDSMQKFKEKKLPPKEAFYNEIGKEHISDEDYNFVQELWIRFKLKNLGELHDLYMVTDVLLLSDVFENFRDFSLENYSLDPAHFFSAPGLSWSAALLHTKVVLEIPHHPDMHMFIDKGLTGGISMVGNQYARANNPGLGEQWKPEQLQSYIMYVDCNNQYGWAMSQYLPTHGFKWVKDIENSHLPLKSDGGAISSTVQEKMVAWTEKIQALEDEGETGYFFEVDLQYPEEMHDAHDNYPLAPEHLNIKDEMMSPYQQKLSADLGVKVGGEKLCLTLNNKTKYICHYRNLKMYLSMGLKLKKVHRVMKFNQSQWLKSYIELNTKLRQEASSKFEEDFAKLMNNSFFGKVRNYSFQIVF